MFLFCRDVNLKAVESEVNPSETDFALENFFRRKYFEGELLSDF